MKVSEKKDKEKRKWQMKKEKKSEVRRRYRYRERESTQAKQINEPDRGEADRGGRRWREGSPCSSYLVFNLLQPSEQPSLWACN